MSNLLVGLGVAGGLLAWMLFRYFDTQEKQQKAREAQRIKEDKYKRVLERAKAAEREEKLFKAQTGHIPSQLSLAKEFELCNLREALYWYLKAAEQNNAIAQNALARLCRMDMEDPEGEAKSRYWEQVLKAQQREPAALYDLGRYQIRGQGTEIDTETGVSNVEAAADAGWLPAQLFLGDWFLSEKNSHKDPQAAFMWRVRAALQNDAKACVKTAYCYQMGIGVEKDKAHTLYWLERAAELDNTEAQLLVARMHLGSAANDAAVAYIWYSMAYVNGQQAAKVERDKAVQRIGIDAILGVQNVANTIYKMIKQEDSPSLAVIQLLDRIYGRRGYRPSREVLQALATGKDVVESEIDDALLIDDPATIDALPKVATTEQRLDNELDNLTWQQGSSPAPRHGQGAGSASGNSSSNSASAGEHKSATKEYQDQTWQASWNTFFADNEDR